MSAWSADWDLADHGGFAALCLVVNFDELYEFIEAAYIAARQELDSWQAANLLGVSRRAVQAALRDGRLRGQKFGRDWRITRQSVEDYRLARQSRTKRHSRRHFPEIFREE